MNIAVIFAGGVGQRMKNSTVPKQFLELYNKPIIVYTLEKFQQCKEIDGIVVACIESWIEHLEMLIKEYSLSKVKAIVPGGETGQQSIRNAVYKAADLFPSDSIVLVHDGVRPLIQEETILKAIDTVKKYGSAITTIPAIETIMISKGNNLVTDIIDRSQCRYARAPQSFYLKDLINAHRKAFSQDNLDFVDSAELMRFYGHKLYMIEGGAENIKITTPSDYYVFKAYIDAENEGNEDND